MGGHGDNGQPPSMVGFIGINLDDGCSSVGTRRSFWSGVAGCSRCSRQGGDLVVGTERPAGSQTFSGQLLTIAAVTLIYGVRIACEVSL